MKNQLVTFLLGGFVFISFAAATTNIMTVKPASPKAVVCFRFMNCEEFRPYLKQGYRIKIISKGDEWESGTVVMEKY